MTSTAEDAHHDATPETDAEAEGHCSKGTAPSEHQSHETATGASSAAAPSSGQLSRGTGGGHGQSCLHCMGAPSAPARSGGFDATENQTRRDSEVTAPLAKSEGILPAIVSFPALRPTQCSPPATAQRRHLLIQIFLI
jgi:hypothetical protein